MHTNISRRDILKGLVAGSGAVITPKHVHAAGKLLLPLESVADSGKLDSIRAAKARKAAEYVITRDKQPGLQLYETHYSPAYDKTGKPTEEVFYQRVRVGMVIDGIRYVIVVNNRNEKLQSLSDHIYIEITPMESYSRKFGGIHVTLDDFGLDGRVNIGVLPIKAGIMIMPNRAGIQSKDVKEREKDTASSLVLILNDRTGQGPQHRDRFQDIYDAAINALLGFYEKPIK